MTAPDYLFYWFFSTRDKNPDAPLIIWTNGGPGCTAMEGATTENGPLFLLDIKEACSGGKINHNESNDVETTVLKANVTTLVNFLPTRMHGTTMPTCSTSINLATSGIRLAMASR